MKTENRLLTKDELTQLAAPTGLQYTLKTRTVSEPIVKAEMGSDTTLSGLRLHYFDGQELAEAQFEIKLKSALVIGILLEGQLDFCVDSTHYQLYAQAIDGPAIFLLNMTQQTRLTRTLHKDNRVRKLIISIDSAVLEHWLTHKNLQCSELSNLISQHGRYFSWKGTEEEKKHANNILTGLKKNHRGLNAIDLEAKIYTLISKCFVHALTEIPTHLNEIKTTSLIPTKALKIQQNLNRRLTAFIHTQQEPNLKTLAQELNLSTSNLQRTFRESFGQSVMEYIRHRRLEEARNAIMRDNVSLGEAAFIAGYNHTSNFAIAFKRLFGVPPGSLKQAFLCDTR